MVSDELIGDLERVEEKQLNGRNVLEIANQEYFLTMGTLSLKHAYTITSAGLTLRLSEGSE